MENTKKAIRLSQLIALAALFLLSGTAMSQAGAPVTGAFSGLVYDRATQTYNSVLTLTNNGQTLNGPLNVTISTGSALVAVTGANAAGANTFVLTVPLANGSMPSGAMQTVVVAFSDPTRVSFTPVLVSVTSNTNTLNSVVSASPTVPSAAISSIVDVLSPNSSSPLGTNISVSLGSSTGESIVFAVNSSGAIVLASIVDSAQTQLSADSTSLAFVRLVLADVTTTQTANQVTAAIRGASTYPSLVQAVQNALDRDSSPATDPTVLQDIAKVAATLVPVLAKPAEQAKHLATPALVSTPTLSGSLPFIVVPDMVLGGLFPVKLTANGVPSVTLSNSMPIPWEVSTTSASGATLEEGNDLPARSLIFPGVTTVTADNAGFNLTVQQTAATRAKIGSDIIVGDVKLLLGLTGMLVGKSCTLAVIQAGLEGSFTLYEKSKQGSLTFKQDMQAFANPINLAPALKNCSASKQFAELLVDVVNLIDEVAILKFIATAAATETEALYANTYWTTKPFTYGVCEGSNWEVTDCATSYTFNPSSVILAPSAVYTPQNLTATAAQGPTLVPAGLNYTAQTYAPFRVDDPSTGQITATNNFLQVIGLGGAPFSLTVSDEATTAKGVLSVSVVVPQIHPTTSSTPVGSGLSDIVALSLTDQNGNPVVLPQGDATWTASVGTSQLQNIGSITNVATTWWVSPPDGSPGSVTINAVGADGTSYGTATIVITPKCADLACKLAGKWEDSTEDGFPYWTVNADGITGTFEYFQGQPSPCYNTPLPAAFSLGSNSFTATAVLGSSTAEFPCQAVWVESLTLDPNGLIAQGTLTINSVGNQPFTSPATWTRASGPRVVVPNVINFDEADMNRRITFASLIPIVTNKVSTTLPPGVVISESPIAGSIVASGSTVGIVVTIAPPN